MARGTQHRKRRPKQDARVAAPAGKKAKGVKHESWEDQLFFSRLRNHAKWMFVLLALIFGLGFVLFGIGSGVGGIGEAFPDLISQSSGPSVSSLQKKVEENPKDADAWRELAAQLQQDDSRLDEAANALTRYTELRPKDLTAYQELGGIYQRQADRHRNVLIALQTRLQAYSPSGFLAPPESSPLAKVYDDPLSSSFSSDLETEFDAEYSKFIGVQSAAVGVYKKIVELRPADATSQFQLGQIAQDAGDTMTAIAAYKKFLQLAPNDAVAPNVRDALKELTATPTATVTGQ